MDKNALRAEFVRNGLTQAQVAAKLGMSESTLWRKLKKGTLGLDEADKLIDILKIKEPNKIFFGNRLT